MKGTVMQRGFQIKCLKTDGKSNYSKILTKYPHRMDPDSIADIYWQTANQPKNCWTFELDVRPWSENW